MNLIAIAFGYVFNYVFTLREIDLENISVSGTWNLRGVCKHIDCRWQVSSSGLWEFAAPDSNAIILKIKSFSNFLFQFWNLHQILNLLKHKLIVIANAFPKLQTVKDLVGPLSKKCRFRTFFDIQHVKGFQTLVKFAWQHFHHIFSSLWEKLIWKISPLVICEILGVFVNKLTVDDKYTVRDCANLPVPIQIELS